jgi:hypothetical protein
MHPPLERCPTCDGLTAFEPVSGRGTLYSWIVVNRPAVTHVPAPYVIALVELVEQEALRLTRAAGLRRGPGAPAGPAGQPGDRPAAHRTVPLRPVPLDVRWPTAAGLDEEGVVPHVRNAGFGVMLPRFDPLRKTELRDASAVDHARRSKQLVAFVLCKRCEFQFSGCRVGDYGPRAEGSWA